MGQERGDREGSSLMAWIADQSSKGTEIIQKYVYKDQSNISRSLHSSLIHLMIVMKGKQESSKDG